jgi:hypothetical protein
MKKKALIQAYSDASQIKKTGQISTIHTESKETEHETERSHCHIIMILSYSEFDRLCYFCEKGSFSLYNTLKLSLNSASDRSHLNLFLHNVRNDQASPAMIDMTG